VGRRSIFSAEGKGREITEKRNMYLELVQFGSVKDAILVRVTKFEYPSKRFDARGFEDVLSRVV
jgi:hypothetical protein